MPLSARLSVGLCIGLALAIAVPAFSHDLWIVPGRFAIQPGEKVRVFINSGDAFPASDARINAARVESFTFQTGPSEKTPVGSLAAEGKSLTAEITSATPGTGILSLALQPRVVRLEGEAFQQYLVEEGLSQMVSLREALGESGAPAVERYTKWAKALVRVGEPEDGRWSEPAGLRLEIVPRERPFTLSAGGNLRVVVLFEGDPLPEATIVGGRAGTPAHRVRAVTDSNGEADIPLKEVGRWYLRALHMIRLQDDAEADWESFWTTMTFEVQG